MAQRISATKLDALIDELRLYWVRNGIGEIDWADKNNMYLKIQKCVDCFDSRYTNYKLCPFKEGYLEAILRTKLGVPLRVREVECCSMKVNCIFHIKFLFDDPLLIQVRA
jgi:predicted hydrocarbon binding protein